MSIVRSTTTWDTFRTDVVDPAADVALAFALVAVALAVAARLLALLPWPVRRSPSRRTRSILGIAGAGLCFLAAALLTVVPTQTTWLTTDGTATAPLHGAWWVPGAVVAVVAVGLVTRWLLVRMRIAIAASNPAGRSSVMAARVAALVGDLGGQPGRGVEVPHGSDVPSLGESIADVPGSSWAAGIVALVQNVLGTAPWHVLVDAADDDHISVVVTRNERQVATATVERGVLRLGADDLALHDATAERVDLYRFAAATVLTALAEAYPHEFDGLAGATDWRSLGMHYVASTDLRDCPEAQRALLALAVEWDPGNWLAQVAYRQALHRRSEDPVRIASYDHWLAHLVEPPGVSDIDLVAGEAEAPLGPGTRYEALRLRTLYTRAALTVNRVFALRNASADARTVATAEARAVATVRTLTTELTAIGAGAGKPSAGVVKVAALLVPPSDSLWQLASEWQDAAAPQGAPPEPLPFVWAGRPARRMSHGADSTAADAADGGAGRHPEVTWRERRHAARLASRATIAFGPTAHYVRACYLVSRAGPGTKDEDFARAVDHLRIAVQVPELKRWMYDDPQLAALRDRAEFAEFRRKGSADLFDLPIFRPHADRLRDAGLTDPDTLLASSEHDISALTGASEAHAAHMQELAQLTAGLKPHLDGSAVTTVRAMIEEDLDHDDALRTTLARSGHAAVVERILDRMRTYPDVDVTPGDARRLTRALTVWLPEVTQR